MTPGRNLLLVDSGDRFERSLREFAEVRQRACLRVIEALANRQATPGMRVKPILPSKFYSEARGLSDEVLSGERLAFRIAEGVLYLIDIVTHDDIARYGAERPKR